MAFLEIAFITSFVSAANAANDCCSSDFTIKHGDQTLFNVAASDGSTTITGPLVVEGLVTAADIVTPDGSISSLFDRLSALEAKITTVIPVGTIIPHASAASTPHGFAPCHGQPVSRSMYASLFAVIGTSFGSGDDSSTFNVPDLRGRTLVGTGMFPGLSTRSVGETGGSERVTLTVLNMPTHTHTAAVSSSGAHTHTVSTGGSHTHPQPDDSYLVRRSTGPNTVAGQDATTGEPMLSGAWFANIGSAGAHGHTLTSSGVHVHTVTIADNGSSIPIEMMNPFVVVHYFIKY